MTCKYWARTISNSIDTYLTVSNVYILKIDTYYEVALKHYDASEASQTNLTPTPLGPYVYITSNLSEKSLSKYVPYMQGHH